MEVFLAEVLLVSSLSLILYAALRAAHGVLLRPKILERQLRQQGIRGTSYKLLHGDMKEIARLSMEALSKPISLNHRIVRRASPCFYEMVQNYGKVSLNWIQTTPRLLLADPELVRLVMTNKNGDFIKPPNDNPLVDLLQMGISTLEGDKWGHRRKLMNPAFHFEKLKGMVPSFSATCSDLVQRWKKLTGPEGSHELDVAPEFHILASDVIARTAFGSRYEDGKRIFELQKEQVVLVLEAYYSIYFPGYRFIPTKKNRRRYAIDREIKATLRDMINKKESAMENGGPESNVDLLGLLLQSSKEANDNEKMTIEDTIEECKLFFFAGQETTANLLSWTMIVLSMHPDWQEKARQEVLQICGKETPDIDQINRLKIVPMILNEVLRLYTPVTALFRHTLRKTNIKGMSIPAGVDIVLFLLQIHHDPDYWGEDAEEFNPERFIQGASKASNDQTAFYPFGWGPRICLGLNFAMIEAKMALAVILQHFSFELSPSYTHAPCLRITMFPQHGAQIILHGL